MPVKRTFSFVCFPVRIGTIIARKIIMQNTFFFCISLLLMRKKSRAESKKHKKQAKCSFARKLADRRFDDHRDALQRRPAYEAIIVARARARASARSASLPATVNAMRRRPFADGEQQKTMQGEACRQPFRQLRAHRRRRRSSSTR